MHKPFFNDIIINMKRNKKFIFILCFIVLSFCTFGCEEQIVEEETDTENVENYDNLVDYLTALELFEEGMEALVYDIETGITYTVRRVVGGYTTLADVETVSAEDTALLLSTTEEGTWSIVRRAVIVTIGDTSLPASISVYEHSGSEDYEYGTIIDNRSGATGTGINLDSIRDNDMIGVVDIYFYNSLIPGINRIDERHQEMVIEAYDFLY